MIQPQPRCTGYNGNLSANVTCFYDPKRRVLVLTNITSVDLPASSNITFSVNTLMNPYNALPKNGFQISTVQNDSMGVGLIDSTDNVTSTL